MKNYRRNHIAIATYFLFVNLVKDSQGLMGIALLHPSYKPQTKQRG